MSIQPRPEEIQSRTYSSSVKSVKTGIPGQLELTGEQASDSLLPLFYEDIMSQEIINIARADTISGQLVIYQPIKNISSIYRQYNPQNIVSLQGIDRNYFRNFPISLTEHTPECGNGPDCKYVYIDSVTGNLIINVINMQPGEQVEVQILAGGTVLDDTIY
jgi:hypothetical protein